MTGTGTDRRTAPDGGAGRARRQPRQFARRVADYLRWRGSNAWDRLWKRAHKVAYHHELEAVDEDASGTDLGVEPAGTDDLSDLPGAHDLEAYRERLAGEHELLLARSGDSVVGFCWLSFAAVGIDEVGATVDFDGDGYLWHVHVVPEYRGQGVGTAMIEAALSVAEERPGCDRAFCLTEWSNLAMRRVLEKTGFEPPEHLSYARTGPVHRWAVHDREPGPFATLLERAVGRDLAGDAG